MKEPVVLHLCQSYDSDLGDHDRPAEDRSDEKGRQDKFSFEGRFRKSVYQSARLSCYQRCQHRHRIVCLTRETVKAIDRMGLLVILEIPGFRLTGIPSCQPSLLSTFCLRSLQPDCSRLCPPWKRKTSMMFWPAFYSLMERFFIPNRPPRQCKRR